MSDRQARLQAISEWLMEFSVLWAVFPFLDVLIEHRIMQPGMAFLSVAMSFVGLLGGILLRRGDSK